MNFNGNDFKPGHIVLALTGIIALLLLFPALAELDRSVWNRDYNKILPAIRIWMIVGSSLAGFALGWFLSPQASELRAIVGAVIAGLAIFVATFNNDALGWGLALLLSLIGFFMALGYWLGRAVKALSERPSTFGSSRWATVDDLNEHRMFEAGGIRLGTHFDGTSEQVISYKGDRHLTTAMITRDGKGTSQIIPNLLSLKNSVLVIDPKGENAMITAQARLDMGQDVAVYDPWNIVTFEGSDGDAEDVLAVDRDGNVGVSNPFNARFNPLDFLQPGDLDIGENAMILADAMVVPSQSSDPFWDNESKGVLQGLLLYVATDPEEASQRNLGRVRELTLLDGEDLEKLFNRMLNSPYHVVASTGARCLQKEEKLLSGVFATLQSHTHFLDSPRVQESLSRSDFKFEDLKTKSLSIYLAIPADRLQAFAPLLRILVQLAITVNARNIEVQPERPILFILDEMPALGRLPAVEQAYGLMAGYGMQLWGFVQDLPQMEKTYGKGWQSFISNSGVVSYGGSADDMSTKYFSSMCGEATVWNFSSAVSHAFGTSSGSGGVTSNSSTTTTDTRAASQRKLAYPDELRRMHKSNQLLFIDNMPPVIARRRRWFEDATLKSKGVNLHK
ncbi:type IV secretory system conjugative DNA transfer family protein [Thalassobius sp. I31.1]|uniref:type IV secretory system conjugative DNA transfer family protein n=1 Tax=Thalassobius sp. I31.1 TaxID=2109912 RepID=UPI000D1B8684|nr:type IV secretory system conjugative DNA transfer family protein [Thalassobius sp. I31.1]